MSRLIGPEPTYDREASLTCIYYASSRVRIKMRKEHRKSLGILAQSNYKNALKKNYNWRDRIAITNDFGYEQAQI